MKKKKIVIDFIKIAVAGGIIAAVYKKVQLKLKEVNTRAERSKAYTVLLNQWINNKNSGKNIKSYFKENCIRTIGIYGMGTIGELLYEEIKDSDITVQYFIEKETKEIYSGIDDILVIGINDIINQQLVDAIIITPFFDGKEVIKDLEDAGVTSNIISIDDIIFQI